MYILEKLAMTILNTELGYRIVVSPNFVSRDDGTFSIVLNYTIRELTISEKVLQFD